MTTTTELRTHLLDELRRDLVGPHAPDELLTDRPTVQYLTGILYPSGVEIDGSEDDSLGLGVTDEDGESSSEVVAFSQTMNPASIGLSFAVLDTISHLKVEVSYGLYEDQETQDEKGKTIRRWQRRPVDDTIIVPINPGEDKKELCGCDDLYLRWVVRSGNGTRHITVSLVNHKRVPDPNRVDDTLCVFQPRLVVRGLSGTHPFVHREPGGTLPYDPDLESHRLLYRDCYEFAVGHGCSVDWNDIQHDQAGVLETAFIPDYELPATTPNTMAGLEMQALADAANPAAVEAILTPLLDDYAAWISQRRGDVAALATDELRNTATNHLNLCDDSLRRMQDGLALLHSDTQVFEAFRFANRAMLLQRSYGQWAQDYRQNGKRATKTPPLSGAWRPFQIAFILLNLASIARPDSSERDIVDLLWFPTGGGKTEAYLGLIAFTIGLRRLRGTIDGMRGDGGVTVIMRYTLRLLTTQQFQRAATLICACEYLRRQAPKQLGEHPFQIGLWVGAGATPNQLTGDNSAEEKLDKLRRGEDVTEGNPVQLSSCPWCGETLNHRHYHIDKDRKRMVLVCPRPACTFHGTAKQPDKGIPALLVDDDIYHQCPTLLLATADKFARLPWKPQTMALFGKVDRYCPRHGYLVHTDDDHPVSHHRAGNFPAVNVENCPPFLPPEFIIQDELHLISGPLGTLSGLYEAAIDVLCSRPGSGNKLIRPKVIASTATIRRAEDQVRNLFARDVQLFPPAGLEAGDSFFATAQPLTQQPGRCYVGIHAPGRSVKTALVRVYAILLQVAGEYLATHGSNVADAYTTLVGYFNSLRELGGARRLLEDDIVQRIEYLAQQRHQPARDIHTDDCELTSRIASRDIPKILGLLEKPVGTSDALDVLLATNMISVGVDVSRLGLMVVNGQPKTSAEYIQATSRVGRKDSAPGIVVTVYNWSRPRDISHYERFRPYHEAIYRHVEATSVTPFAPRARDKALHAIVIALARLLREQWADNKAASRFDRSHPMTQRILDHLHTRVQQVDASALPEVEQQLQTLLDWWQQMITIHGTALQYQPNPYKPNAPVPVLIHAAEEKRKDGSRPTLNSLREVEGESQLFVKLSN
jgi:hypothetical protein